MIKYVTYSLVLSLAQFLIMIGGFYLLSLIVNNPFQTIKAWNIPFINSHPTPFIICVAIALFFTLIIFKFFSQDLKPKILFLILWLLIALTFGGTLWAYYDMGDTGYLGGQKNFAFKALLDIKKALFLGPISLIIFAFPLNVISLFGFFRMKKVIDKITTHDTNN